jgi:hypothetical protein
LPAPGLAGKVITTGPDVVLTGYALPELTVVFAVITFCQVRPPPPAEMPVSRLPLPMKKFPVMLPEAEIVAALANTLPAFSMVRLALLPVIVALPPSPPLSISAM